MLHMYVTHQAPLSIGVFQARILECVAISYSRGSSQSKDITHLPTTPALAGEFLTLRCPRSQVLFKGGGFNPLCLALPYNNTEINIISLIL